MFEHGVSLARGPLRAGASDDEVAALLSQTWHARTDRYSEERGELTPKNGQRQKVEMSHIGG